MSNEMENERLKNYADAYSNKSFGADDLNKLKSSIMDMESKAAAMPGTIDVPVSVKPATTIQFHEEAKEEVVDEKELLAPDIAKVEQSIEEKSARLEKLQEQYEVRKASTVNLSSTDDSPEGILDAIINDDNDPIDNKKPSELTAEEILASYEEKKTYIDDYDHNEYNAGPSNYIIESDDEYIANVDEILRSNNMDIVHAPKDVKKAMINRYINTGTAVTLTLPNTGIYITISGAGIEELVAMANIPQNFESGRNINNEPIIQVTKLKFIFDHIKDSTIGKFQNVQQMLSVISYYDIPTLYYGFFAATHPKVVDIERPCKRCGKPYNVKLRTTDLLLNYKDYKRTDEDIKNNVTYAQFLKSNKMSTIAKHVLSNGLILYYKHPSIASFIKTLKNLNRDTMDTYPDIVPYAYSIEKIAMLSDPQKNKFIEFDDPNQIVEIIARSKDYNLKFEISDIIDTVKNEITPEYGFGPMICPHCRQLDSETKIYIDDLLFTTARTEYLVGTLAQAVREEKKSKPISNE